MLIRREPARGRRPLRLPRLAHPAGACQGAAPPSAPAACSSGGSLPGGGAPFGSRGLLIRREPARGRRPLRLPRLAHPAGACQGAAPPSAPAACSSGGSLPGGGAPFGSRGLLIRREPARGRRPLRLPRLAHPAGACQGAAPPSAPAACSSGGSLPGGGAPFGSRGLLIRREPARGRRPLRLPRLAHPAGACQGAAPPSAPAACSSGGSLPGGGAPFGSRGLLIRREPARGRRPLRLPRLAHPAGACQGAAPPSAPAACSSGGSLPGGGAPFGSRGLLIRREPARGRRPLRLPRLAHPAGACQGAAPPSAPAACSSGGSLPGGGAPFGSRGLLIRREPARGRRPLRLPRLAHPAGACQGAAPPSAPAACSSGGSLPGGGAPFGSRGLLIRREPARGRRPLRLPRLAHPAGACQGAAPPSAPAACSSGGSLPGGGAPFGSRGLLIRREPARGRRPLRLPRLAHPAGACQGAAPPSAPAACSSGGSLPGGGAPFGSRGLLIRREPARGRRPLRLPRLAHPAGACQGAAPPSAPAACSSGGSLPGGGAPFGSRGLLIRREPARGRRPLRLPRLAHPAGACQGAAPPSAPAACSSGGSLPGGGAPFGSRGLLIRREPARGRRPLRLPRLAHPAGACQGAAPPSAPAACSSGGSLPGGGAPFGSRGLLIRREPARGRRPLRLPRLAHPAGACQGAAPPSAPAACSSGGSLPGGGAPFGSRGLLIRREPARGRRPLRLPRLAHPAGACQGAAPPSAPAACSSGGSLPGGGAPFGSRGLLIRREPARGRRPLRLPRLAHPAGACQGAAPPSAPAACSSGGSLPGGGAPFGSRGLLIRREPARGRRPLRLPRLAHPAGACQGAAPPSAPAACSSGGSLPGGGAPFGSRGLLIRREPARGRRPLRLPRLAHPAGACQGAAPPSCGERNFVGRVNQRSEPTLRAGWREIKTLKGTDGGRE